MPTYQYKCKSCSDVIEVQQSFTDDPITEAPGCTQKDFNCELKKVFSAVSIAFKGEGFYKNDSVSNKKPSPNTSSESKSSDTQTDTSASSKDTTSKKPAEKATS